MNKLERLQKITNAYDQHFANNLYHRFTSLNYCSKHNIPDEIQRLFRRIKFKGTITDLEVNLNNTMETLDALINVNPYLTDELTEWDYNFNLKHRLMMRDVEILYSELLDSMDY